MTDYEALVRGYLADCEQADRELAARGSALNPEHHPAEAGAVKLIFGDGKAIRAAYRAVTGSSGERPTS